MDPCQQEVANCELPCAEGLLAGTLALMTAYAQNCCAERRGFLVSKIAVNLSTFVRHTSFSDPFRSAVGKLHAQWARLSPGSGEPFWHAMPNSVQ